MMLANRSMMTVLSIAFGFLLLSSASAVAQEATPAAEGDCPVTTVEENVALVERLYEAVANSDAETIDEIFADDYTHNVDRFGLPDDPTSNEDEIQLVMMMHQFYPGSTDVIREIFGADNKVVLESTRTIDGHTFTGELTSLEEPFEFRTIAILTIECGEVVSMNAMANTLDLMVALGVVTLPEIGPEATPEA
jgi:ketosteroid isomerase-like protein